MVLILFLLLTSSFVVLVLFWPQENPHQVVKVTVKNGVSLNRIAEVLNEQDIISNKLMFRMAVQLLGKEKEIPIGRFRLVNARSNYEIIDQLVYGAPEVKKVRILEGWDLRQIAGHLREVMDFDSSLIMQIATDYKF